MTTKPYEPPTLEYLGTLGKPETWKQPLVLGECAWCGKITPCLRDEDGDAMCEPCASMPGPSGKLAPCGDPMCDACAEESNVRP